MVGMMKVTSDNIFDRWKKTNNLTTDQKKHSSELTNKDLYNLVRQDEWPELENKDVLDKFHKYLIEIHESKGFVITDFPGNFFGVTEICPAQYILEKSNIFSEKYAEVIVGAEAAIKRYNEEKDKEFVFKDVVTLNATFSTYVYYYITFTAEDVNDGVETFQAKVMINIFNTKVEVKYCGIIKPN